MARTNPIHYVEQIKAKIDRDGAIDESELVRSSTYLGMRTKKIEAFLNRYKEVFSKLIAKKCVDEDEYKICIYSWNQRVPYRIFPASLYSNGTILLFNKKTGEVSMLVDPMPKALSLGKSPGLPLDKYGGKIPYHTSLRVDGFPVYLYYNPVIDRWIFSTRYVLHNMYYVKGKLVIEDLKTIANPYVDLCDRIASDSKLYQLVEKYRGWVFIFNLLGPEPSILSPPYPIGADPSEYKLYLVASRSSDGKLYTANETLTLTKISWRHVPEVVENDELINLYNNIKHSINIRSIIAWIRDNNELVEMDPLIVEIESEIYPDAMRVKYENDAKSLALLISQGLKSYIQDLVDPRYAEVAEQIHKLYVTLQDTFNKLSEKIDLNDIDLRIEQILSILREHEPNLSKINKNEIKASLASGKTQRIIKKILALYFDNKSLAQESIYESTLKLIEKINSVKTHA